MLGKTKKLGSYINLAVFTLAAAGLVTVVTKTKKFITQKGDYLKDMFKK